MAGHSQRGATTDSEPGRVSGGRRDHPPWPVHRHDRVVAVTRVSVLIPCRNAGQFITEAIASIESQSYRDFEVVAVDDGSTDGTGEHLERWAARDARVRVIGTPARGLVSALRTGLAAASGELIARMDADDIASAGRLERQVTLLDTEPGLAACGTQVRYFPRARVRGGARRYERWINSLGTPEQIARDIFVECPIAHPTLMVRRKALEAAGGYRDPGWPEDYDLILRLWASGYPMANAPDVLLHWREGNDRLSRTDPRYSEASFRRCKVNWLTRTLLAGRDGAVVWGAGPVGKAFARELASAGVPVCAFVDLDPRKIGQQIHGAPVVDPSRINHFRTSLALAAVGSDQARAEIRAALDAAGWREMKDYCAVA